ncbi:MAG: hypothetical protein XE01_1087 [Synergistales bacterium 58_81]|nr:MAG: hypothetical protein XE01_1087 [Synergistales bacterium 58_81]
MVLRIRCSRRSGDYSVTTKLSADLIGGLDMWHKDSAGNWYMSETKTIEAEDAAPAKESWAGKTLSAAFPGMGPESSIFLFSSKVAGQ